MDSPLSRTKYIVAYFQTPLHNRDLFLLKIKILFCIIIEFSLYLCSHSSCHYNFMRLLSSQYRNIGFHVCHFLQRTASGAAFGNILC